MIVKFNKEMNEIQIKSMNLMSISWFLLELVFFFSLRYPYEISIYCTTYNILKWFAHFAFSTVNAIVGSCMCTVHLKYFDRCHYYCTVLSEILWNIYDKNKTKQKWAGVRVRSIARSRTRALVGTWYIIQIFVAFFNRLKTTVLFTVFAVKPLCVQVYNEHFYSRIKLSMEIFVIIFRLGTICDHFKWPLSRILSMHRLHATFFRMQ